MNWTSGLNGQSASSARTEYAAPDRAALFDTLLATAVDGIIVIDQFGCVLVYSRACERMFGYTQAEVVGRNVRMLMPPPYRAEHDSYLARYRETGERRIIGIGREVVGRRKNGTTFPMYLSVGEGRIGGGGIFIGVVHDITDRRRARESLQLLASVVEYSDDAIISTNPAGIITSWNRGAARIYGYSAEEVLGTNVAFLVPPDRKAEEPFDVENLRRRGQIEHYETERLRKDGTSVYISLTVSAIRDSSGEIVGIAKIGRDISARVADERRLNELQRNLIHTTRLLSAGELGSALAHELNQPLTAILNYTGVLEDVAANASGEEGKLLRDLVGRIAAQTERAGAVIGRLRNFVAKREPKRLPQDVNQVVDESLALGMVGPLNQGIRLDLHLDGNLPPVWFDRVQIQQVMINLIKNAVDAMQETPRRELHIATVRDGGWVQVSVADSGTGLAPRVAAALFEPFLTTKDNGLGIGLPICRTIVEAHGGRLWVQDNEGGGAVFHFRLPIAHEEAVNEP